MPARLTRLKLAAAIFLCLAAIGCAPKEEGQKAAFKSGLVFDIGGRGDKSFNDAAFRGVEMAKERYGVGFEYIEPGEGADREAALRQLSSQSDVQIIIGAGFIFTDDITAVAKEFPNKKYVCIDYSVDPTKPIPDNLAAITFREEEGSFLVGALAAMVSKTGTIGFVGGMDSPLIRKFQKGYENGAKYARPDIKVLVGYAGLTGEGFKNPAKGKELALSQYDKGADIIYHASGITGLGVFEAAREKMRYVIGVDMNQENEGRTPDGKTLTLTSMVKIVDEIVLNEIAAAKNGTFKGGHKSLGLAEKGVDYVYNDVNRSLIPDSVRARVEALREKIIKGEIKPM
ncbi:MAG: BMP family ABC transporter substrate-binding protein [Chloroherpetonaceae bacterium]|nr:BMP family ABC transporter substrate-binding protein [Chloroherpetonaceae bacterium]MDW8437820.1 BMP family ABC transporter substrate-binding protein [Chloroherpetonaceae bacterium]